MQLICLEDALQALLKNQYSKEYCKEHNIEPSISVDMLPIILDSVPKYERKVGKWTVKRIAAYYGVFCPFCGARQKILKDSWRYTEDEVQNMVDKSNLPKRCKCGAFMTNGGHKK